jgi:hypothetical protein
VLRPLRHPGVEVIRANPASLYMMNLLILSLVLFLDERNGMN